jgi:hypothetical protein
LNPTLPSSAALIDSFLKDLRGIAGLFSDERTPDTFTVTMDAATGTSVYWVADRDCRLVQVGWVQVGGNSQAIARTNLAATVVNTPAGTVTANKVIAWTGPAATWFPFSNHREFFRSGEKVWLCNQSAGTTIAVLVFET